MKKLEIDNIQSLLTDLYKRLKNKEISKEQAKAETDILKAIIEVNEISRVKEQLAEIKSLLTANKK